MKNNSVEGFLKQICCLCSKYVEDKNWEFKDYTFKASENRIKSLCVICQYKGSISKIKLDFLLETNKAVFINLFGVTGTRKLLIEILKLIESKLEPKYECDKLKSNVSYLSGISTPVTILVPPDFVINEDIPVKCLDIGEDNKKEKLYMLKINKDKISMEDAFKILQWLAS